MTWSALIEDTKFISYNPSHMVFERGVGNDDDTQDDQEETDLHDFIKTKTRIV